MPFSVEVGSIQEISGELAPVPSDRLIEIINGSGFKIHEQKTRIMHRFSRQAVTGLVVNEKVSVRPEYRRVVRAMVHRLVRTGEYFSIVEGLSDQGLRDFVTAGTLDQLQGRLGFIDHVRMISEHQFKKSGNPPGKTKEQFSADQRLYRRFLYYRTFYANKIPVIICEGKTDAIYLTVAIRRLAAEYPALAKVGVDGQIKIIPRILNQSRQTVKIILNSSEGGDGVLNSFINQYEQELLRFGGPGLQHPALIIFDNDTAGRGIINNIKKRNSSTIVEDKKIFHIVRNLYAIATPGDNTSIEDCFGTEDTATIVNGKTFNRKNEFDTAEHYGKARFANIIVKGNQDRINVDGFRPLLDRVSTVISEYQSRVRTQLNDAF